MPAPNTVVAKHNDALEGLGRYEQIRMSEDVVQAAYTAYYCVDPYQKCDALDIGANHGHHASRLAWLLRGRGKVVAVEPVVEIAGLLASNIRHALLDNVIVEQKAVADFIGRASFAYIPQISQLSAIAGTSQLSSYPDSQLEQPVDVVTVPWLIERHNIAPRIWKVDAECRDYEVLNGAQTEIRRLRPFIAFEWNPGIPMHENFEIYDLLKSLDYDLMNVCGDVLSREDWYFGEGFYFWNYLALPKEHDAARSAVSSALTNFWQLFQPASFKEPSHGGCFAAR